MGCCFVAVALVAVPAVGVEGFGAVARRWFVAVSMRFCNIGTERGIAARPHVDRHYLSEFILIVFLLGTWLSLAMPGLKYEMGVGENGSGIGGKGGGGIRMLAGLWELGCRWPSGFYRNRRTQVMVCHVGGNREQRS